MSIDIGKTICLVASCRALRPVTSLDKEQPIAILHQKISAEGQPGQPGIGSPIHASDWIASPVKVHRRIARIVRRRTLVSFGWKPLTLPQASNSGVAMLGASLSEDPFTDNYFGVPV